MRKALLVVIGLFLFTSLSFAGQETIKDDNDGNKGYILINTGIQQGGNDVGHWTDITTIPELKGEQGIAGFDGLNGINGLDGQNGLDGYTPIKGINYFDGIDGINGEDGLDFDPAEVIRLDGRIDTETFDRISGDNLLQDNINNETTQRVNGDITLNKKINKETSQRKIADTKLNNKIVNETTNRKQADKVLQNNINVVDTNSRNRDNVLQENINTETTGRINGDNFLNSRINDTNIVVDNHSKTLQDHENRISNLNGRVGKLEKTQVNIRTEVKFIREKHLEVGVYSTYSTTRSACAEVGLNVVIPIGESYLDRENTKINARLDKIDKQLGNSTVITKTLDSKGNTKSLQISQGQLSINGEF